MRGPVPSFPGGAASAQPARKGPFVLYMAIVRDRKIAHIDALLQWVGTSSVAPMPLIQNNDLTEL